MTDKSIYRIVFHNQGNVYELYAREISQSSMYAFVEIGDIIFGERSKLVVDPSDEKLKAEFSGVKRTYVPLHAGVRIDEVERRPCEDSPGWRGKGQRCCLPHAAEATTNQ